MDADINAAVNALLDDDSGSDWEKEFCDDVNTRQVTPLKELPSSSDVDCRVGDRGVPPPNIKHLEILKNYFGHSNFRPMQWKIIYSILEKKEDNCVIMATGYGKSLCYQYPAIYCNGTTVVISPLISLMQDQVLSLRVANISACFLGSAQSKKGEVMYNVMNGEYRVVYVTPEYLSGSVGENFIKEIKSNHVKVNLIAIDEAHCVSQWGHDFRNTYRNLGKIRDMLPNVPFLAVTATATPEIRSDIIKSLHLRNPNIICTGFDRPNLYLKVCPKGNNVTNDLMPFMVKVDGRWGFRGSTIIYCPTKKKTSSVLENLIGLGVECEEYHAGMKQNNRKKVHEDFVRDRIKVIVATVAFGMGIDKPDVRLIIHYGAPQDIESYYQEIGRAGRDGLPASCIIFYSLADFAVNRHFQSAIKNASFRKHKEDMSRKIENYLETTECRRRLILSHFKDIGMKKESLTSKCCDNCTRKQAMVNAGMREREYADLDSLGRYDFTEDSKLMIGAVDALGGRFGLAIPILFLRGSKSKKINDNVMKDPLYGKGKEKSEEYWKNFGRLLLREGYLEENTQNNFRGNFGSTHFPVATFKVSRKGKELLKQWSKKPDVNSTSNSSVLLIPPSKLLQLIQQMKKRRSCSSSSGPHMSKPLNSATESVSNNIVDFTSSAADGEDKVKHILYTELVKLRNYLATENDVMPYMVASDKSLLEMTKCRPSSTINLKKVDGMSEAKIQKFGSAFIGLLVKFSKTHNLNLDDFEEVNVCQEDVLMMTNCLSDTIKETYVAFQMNNYSIESLVKSRGLKEGTIVGHLIEAMKMGLKVDLLRIGFSLSTYRKIEKVVLSPPINRDICKLGPIKNLCPPEITWDDLKIALGILNLKFKMRNPEFENKLQELFSSHQRPFVVKKDSMPFQADPLSSGSRVDSKNSEQSFDEDETPQLPNDKRFPQSSEKLVETVSGIMKKPSAYEKIKVYASKIQYLDEEGNEESSSDIHSDQKNEIFPVTPSSKFTFKKPSFLSPTVKEKLSCFRLNPKEESSESDESSDDGEQTGISDNTTRESMDLGRDICDDLMESPRSDETMFESPRKDDQSPTLDDKEVEDFENMSPEISKICDSPIENLQNSDSDMTSYEVNQSPLSNVRISETYGQVSPEVVNACGNLIDSRENLDEIDSSPRGNQSPVLGSKFCEKSERESPEVIKIRDRTVSNVQNPRILANSFLQKDQNHVIGENMTAKIEIESSFISRIGTSEFLKEIADDSNKRKTTGWAQAQKEIKKRKTKLANL